MLASPRRNPVYSIAPYTHPYNFPTQFQITVPDVDWYNAWSKVGSVIIGFLLILSSAAIIGLEIANLTIDSAKDQSPLYFGAGTAKVGAGLWCGSISLLTGILVLMIIFVNNKRIAATFVLIAVICAFILSFILVALSANAIQLYNNGNINIDDSFISTVQLRLIIAMLSLALFNVILCIIFIILYNVVFFSSSTRQPTKY